MADIPLLSKRASAELDSIHGELASILLRYRKINPYGDGPVYVIGDVLRMHEHVWDAVDLLRDEVPTLSTHAAILEQLYQTRRDKHTGAVSLSRLDEMIELIGLLLEHHGNRGPTFPRRGERQGE